MNNQQELKKDVEKLEKKHPKTDEKPGQIIHPQPVKITLFAVDRHIFQFF